MTDPLKKPPTDTQTQAFCKPCNRGVTAPHVCPVKFRMVSK